MGKRVACIGDSSDHGGTITSHNQDGLLKVSGVVLAVEGASHSCPIDGHGTTTISAITLKSYHNGKLILTTGAVAGCGAAMVPPDRKLYVE